MNSELLQEVLVCPACGGELATEARGEILRCIGGTRGQDGSRGCGVAYPVVDGIPRMFVGEMRRTYVKDFPEMVRRYPDIGTAADPAGSRSETEAMLKTRASFGYEWTVYHAMLPEWEENARFYFEPINLGELAGKKTLDAGCGIGRHAYYAARAGASVVAMDFSRAIEVARRNCEGAGNVCFVQADLLAPPFRAAEFDCVYSFGVLHHLPAPEDGFRKLVSRARPGGTVAVYVYHWPEGRPVQQVILKGVEQLRTVTTRMPYTALRVFAWVFGMGLYLTYLVPCRLLGRLPGTNPHLQHLPLQAYTRYPSHVIITDSFDRLSAPIEKRYRQGEVRAWLEQAGLVDLRLLPGYGWRAAGRVPVQASPRKASGLTGTMKTQVLARRNEVER